MIETNPNPEFAFVSFLTLVGFVFGITSATFFLSRKIAPTRIGLRLFFSQIISGAIYVLMFSFAWRFDEGGMWRPTSFLDAIDYYSVIILNLWISFFISFIVILLIFYVWLRSLEEKNQRLQVGLGILLVIALFAVFFFSFQLLPLFEGWLLGSTQNQNIYQVWIIETPNSSLLRVSGFWNLTVDFWSSLGLNEYISKLINFLIWLGGLIQGTEYLLKFLRKMSGTVTRYKTEPKE